MKKAISPILAIAFLTTTLIPVFAQTQEPYPGPGQPQNQPGYAPNPQDSQNDQDDAGLPRVARLSFLQGGVSFMRAGDSEWVEAVENLPLLPGDQVFCPDGARAEIELSAGTVIRMTEGSTLAITDLSETVAQFEVTQGRVYVDASHLRPDFMRFEIDTPRAAFLIQSDGSYRVDVISATEAEVAVKRGMANVTTETGDLLLRSGDRFDLGASGAPEVAALGPFDDADLWGFGGNSVGGNNGGGNNGGNSPAGFPSDPGSYYSPTPSPDCVGVYESSYPGYFGVDELAGYGAWSLFPGYGYSWIPRVGSGWAPYRAGHWVWVPRAGWTWVSNERWGWAPYHYGRWQFIPGTGWAWIPGFTPGFRPGVGVLALSTYRWRPGLVYFFNYPSTRGSFVGWAPLGPGAAWHRPEWYARNPISAGIVAGWQRPGIPNGVSVVPVSGFNGLHPISPSAPGSTVGSLFSGPGRLTGVTSGLPRIAPGPASRGGRFGSGIAARPSPEILNRSVITRSLASTVAGVVPRDRRVIGSGSVKTFDRGSFRQGDVGQRGANRTPTMVQSGPSTGSRTEHSGAGNSQTQRPLDRTFQRPEVVQSSPVQHSQPRVEYRQPATSHSTGGSTGGGTQHSAGSSQSHQSSGAGAGHSSSGGSGGSHSSGGGGKKP